jgi:predicted 2-oxoglutarate/Fe(II)-dependent dioxygenase YbiX
MKYQYYLISDFLDCEEIKELNQTLENNVSKNNQEVLFDGNYKKTSVVNSIQHSHVWDQLDRFRNMIHHTNRNYFGLDLFEISKYSTVNYNVYNGDDYGQYTWHSDAEFNQCYDLKLTALLNLSTEEFLGGDLILFLSGEYKIDNFNKPGSLLIFPAWTQHKVTPVTSGFRKTLSFWAAGPNLK